ncbi:MAG TPA: hypothetical protein VF006_21245 [Longimicrobium sp.]
MDSSSRAWRRVAAAAVLGGAGALAGMQVGVRLDPTPPWSAIFAVVTGLAGALLGVVLLRGGAREASRAHLGIHGFCICLGAALLCLSESATALDIALTLWMIGIILQADAVIMVLRKRHPERRRRT